MVSPERDDMLLTITIAQMARWRHLETWLRMRDVFRIFKSVAFAFALCARGGHDHPAESVVSTTCFQGILPNVASPPLPPEAFFLATLTIEGIAMVVLMNCISLNYIK